MKLIISKRLFIYLGIASARRRFRRLDARDEKIIYDVPISSIPSMADGAVASDCQHNRCMTGIRTGSGREVPRAANARAETANNGRFDDAARHPRIGHAEADAGAHILLSLAART
ncbi:hypothetical protein [Massilia sp. YIM B02443]|uniref:hypothetical protein n=1 Tax=Massilia sp. YIM B02443 TaxID=3050127 RepID=UPI0025B64298|nr:hypothetical protein [Massilia sp. YIM B02443]MDN4039562.1 hypothetical protein [Massilia sp. YIM B02443]